MKVGNVVYQYCIFNASDIGKSGAFLFERERKGERSEMNEIENQIAIMLKGAAQHTEIHEIKEKLLKASKEKL